MKILSEQTIRDNSVYFDNPEDVPRHVVTMGISTIMEARHCLLLANGYLQSGQFDAALEMFAKADEGQPNPALLAFRRARVEAVRKNIPEALAQLQQYLESGQTEAGTSPYELLRRLLLVQTGDKQQLIHAGFVYGRWLGALT